MKTFSLSSLSLVALLAFGCDNESLEAPVGDNTEINQRDRSDSVKTPLDQNENQEDIDITASIRSQVMDDKMSVNAQNAKIITQDGVVTLRGPVASADEKAKLEAIARKVAGDANVDNQLDIVE